MPFFGIGMKTDLFQSCGHCWVFQIWWHIECSIFTALSFRIWNSSTGIPSHPLALFVVMLSKAHLTSHSRMSGSRWVITSFWLSGSWRSFLYSSLCILKALSKEEAEGVTVRLLLTPAKAQRFCLSIVINHTLEIKDMSHRFSSLSNRIFKSLIDIAQQSCQKNSLLGRGV